MDNLEPVPAPQPQPTVSDAQTQYAALRQLIAFVLVLLLLVSGTLTIFLLRQYRSTQAEVKTLNQLIADYNKVSAPLIGEFVKKLSDYERSHPDFGPILLKYGIKPGGATGAPPATATPPKK